VWARAADTPPAGEPLISRRLEPGDCLYLPKGTPHGAKTEEGPSGHLTVGILATTWGGLLAELAREVSDRPGFDEPLPPGYLHDPGAFAAEIGGRVRQLAHELGAADPVAVAERWVTRFLTNRPSMLSGAFLDALADPALDPRTELRRRPGSICELRVDGDRMDVLLGDRRLRMPAWVEPAMRTVACAVTVTATELTPWIDPGSGMVLVRRLVREGLLEVVGDGDLAD
jgi:hypothetical protein